MDEKTYTLLEKLTEVVKKSPDKIALQIKKHKNYEKYTYQDLYKNSQSIAQSLIELGVQKGDRVAIVLENRPEWIFIYFGILFAGTIAVPLDPQSTQEDLKYFFKHSESKIVFTSSGLKPTIYKAAQSIKTLQNIVLLDEEKTVESHHQILFFSDFLNHSIQSLEKLKILPDDIASILYTSGTTGKPKGVMLTHKNFYSNFHSIEKLKFFTQKHNILSILPLHHSFPFMVTIIIPLFSQSKITYVDSLKREEILSCARETNATALVGVPQFFHLFYQSLLDEIKNYPFFIRLPLLGLVNLSYQFRQLTRINLNKLFLSKIHAAFGKHLKYFVCGGAKLDEAVETFLDKIGFTLIQGYGLTETAPVVTFNPIQKPKIGSVGKVIPDVKIKIVDPDKKGVGEVVIRGPNVMKGYYKRKKETQEILKDHWFYSGDLGYLDKQGYLYLTGRKKELIILSTGKNISPEEVEAYYVNSPYIKELCALSIIKDKEEKLVAVIIPDFEYSKKTGEINIPEIIKLELDILSKNFPPYKCIMGFVIAKEALSRTRLGKLKRHEIQDKYLHELRGIKPKTYQEEEINEEDLEILSSPIYKTISDIIKKEKHLKKPVQLNNHLGIDLGFDSLSRIELIAALEKQFNIRISELLMAKISTLKELVLALDKLITEQKSKTPQVLKMHIKETLWKDILNVNPAKNIADKIDIFPGLFAKTADILFCGGLYIISKLMWRIKILGTKNLPKDTPFVLCPNHTSYLDAFLIAAAVPNWLKLRIFFLGFSMYFEIPIVRNLIKIGRIIPLDPSTRLIDAMQACSYVLRHNKAICIFPEGGRSPDGSIQPFKKGIGILAHELNIPLVPVYIDDAFKVLPRGKSFPNFHRIKIIFGKPISARQLKEKDSAKEAKDAYEMIARGIQEEVSNLKHLMC